MSTHIREYPYKYVQKSDRLYLAVAINGSESRKITQLLHPTLAA